MGRHHEVVGELEALVSGGPLRERRWAQLMVALYRDGRQAESLDAFHRLRRVLERDLGVVPSAGLRHLQVAILRQSPELARHSQEPPRDPVPLEKYDSAGDLRVLESPTARAYSLIRLPRTGRTGGQRGLRPAAQVYARYMPGIPEVHRRSMGSLAWLPDRGRAGPAGNALSLLFAVCSRRPASIVTAGGQ